MRVLHILEPSDGGVAKHLLDLVPAQIARGHTVELVVADRHGFPAALRALGAGVAIADYRPEIGRLAADARVLRRLVALLRRGQWDVVHTHGNKGGVLGRAAAARFGVPVVHSPHGFAYLSQRRRARRGAEARRQLTLQIERALAPVADVIVCVSADERRSAVADGIAPESSFAVVPNGVRLPAAVEADPRVAAVPGGGPVLGYLARLSPEKGPLLFVAALERLAVAAVPFRAVIAGNGPQEIAVRAAVERAGLAERVLIVPFEGESLSLLSAFDVYVLPSLFESLPIGLLEAMSVALPAVAADVGGVHEAVLDGRTGLLFEPGDVGALADSLTRLAGDADLRTRMGSAARAHCREHFSFETMVEGVMDAYERARERRWARARS